MTIRVLAGCLVLLALGSPIFAQELKPTVEVHAEYLMSIEGLLGSRAPVGQRAVVNVTGGSVRGPNIKGEIVAPAGDWLFVMPDGSNRLDVRFTIKTDDGAYIFVEYGGIIALSKDAVDRLAKGEVVNMSDNPGYFITAPRFMTESPKYSWLNHVQAVGKMVSLQRGVRIRYDLFVIR
jgi:Protein of unknown function (DUF3237)